MVMKNVNINPSVHKSLLRTRLLLNHTHTRLLYTHCFFSLHSAFFKNDTYPETRSFIIKEERKNDEINIYVAVEYLTEFRRLFHQRCSIKCFYSSLH